MSEQYIYIRLTEAQANTLLRIAETHPDASKWGAKGTRNEITKEIRAGLSAGVRGDGIDWASEAEGLKQAAADPNEWTKTLGDQHIAKPNDIRAHVGLAPQHDGDEVADGELDVIDPLNEVGKSSGVEDDGQYNEADGTYDELFQNPSSESNEGDKLEGEPDVPESETNEDDKNEDDSNNS